MFKYPSSKYYSEIEYYLERGFDGNIVVPFVGAGMDVIRFLRSHKPNFIWLNDIDIGITSFWKAVKNYPTTLISKLKKYNPDAAHFFEFKEYLSEIKSPPVSCEEVTDIALLKIIVHTMSHQSRGEIIGAANPQKMWLSNQISSKQILEASSLLRGQRVRITSWDFSKVLDDKESDGFVYLDPPDLSQDYWDFSIKRHWELSEWLYDNIRNRKWMLTYRDHPTIRKLYSFAQVFKHKKELIIVNYS